MQCVDNYTPRKSFNTYGIVVLMLYVSFGIIVTSIASSPPFNATFQCNTDTKISKSLTTSRYINTECSLKYQEKFLFIAPIIVMFAFNFGVVIVLSIIYGYLVKHRVEKFDYSTRTTTSNNDDQENQPMMPVPNVYQNPKEVRKCLGHFSTFCIYVIYLIFSRIIPMLIFAIWVFYPADIPNHYSCPLFEMRLTETSSLNETLNQQFNSTFVDCKNPSGAKSNILIDVVATSDVILAILAVLELCYIAWLTLNDRSFSNEQEFCTVYLLRKRKRIRKVVNKLREKMDSNDPEIFKFKDDFGERDISLRKLEEIYVNVVIQEGREDRNAYPEEFIRHRIYEAHLKTAKSVTKLQSTADIFKPTRGPEQNQKYPRSILVIGRPGIGKTTLTKKLLHQWKQKEDEFWHEKIVILLQFRTFNNKTVTLREMLSYGNGLSFDDLEGAYSSITSNPVKAILIFDGLDELTVDSENLCSNTESGRSPDENMSVYSIFRMLVSGKWLKGATVLTTSRPTAQHLFQNVQFERTVEILGFFDTQIQEYVVKFCQNSRISELIWNEIKASAEMHSLCYIPVNSYIVCLTLKESVACDENRGEFDERSRTNTPQTITELYKRAIRVLLYRHHPKYKEKQWPNDYLIIPLPKDLKDELMKLKEVAKNGISEGKLIFERRSSDEFGDLANCGLFHKLPDKRRNFFCFLHLTLQEFLAAASVVDDLENVDKFLEDHVGDPKWHLVIQFVAGLVGDKIKEPEETFANVREEEESENLKIIANIEKRLKEWASLLGTGSKSNNIAFLGIKCLYELQDIDIIRSVSSDFKGGEYEKLSLDELTITPVDATALFEFLRNRKNLKHLEFNRGEIQGDYVYQKMTKLLLNNPNGVDDFGDKTQKFQSDAIRSNYCQLTELHFNTVSMTDQGVKYLSDALTSENCKLTSLVLIEKNISAKGAKCLSDALQSENCKLTALNLTKSKINDAGAKYLSHALKSTNCKLTALLLGYVGMNEEGAKCLSDALTSKNCKLTALNISGNNINDEGAKYLSNALKSENCKLISLDLRSSEINDEGAKFLSDALKSRDCKLTFLNLSVNKINDEGAKYLSNALTSGMCKLTYLELIENNIKDEGAKFFRDATKSENCKLNTLAIGKYNGDLDPMRNLCETKGMKD